MGNPTVRQLPRHASTSFSRSWLIAGVGLSGTVFFILIVYAQTAESIFTAWVSSNLYSHGLLVIPAVAYLLWRRRDALAREIPAPSPVGLLAVVVAALIWLLGEATTTYVFKHLGLVLMLQAVVFTLLGWRIFWIARFPLAYLFFAVPFGAGLIPPLQDATAEMVTPWLQASGIPTHLSGHRIVTPIGAFYIAEACAGARFLISAVAVGAFAADLFYRQTWRKIALIGLSIAVPVIANALRAYGIILVAVEFGRDSGLMVDHVTYGLVFLSLVILGILGLGLLFREPSALQVSQPTNAAVNPKPIGKKSSAILPVITVIAISAPVIFASGTDFRNHTAAVMQPMLDLEPPGTWQPVVEAMPDWRPRIPGSDFEFRRSFRSEKAEVVLYVAYFVAQRQGAEVVNEQNRVAGNLSSQVIETMSQSLRIDSRLTDVPCVEIARSPSSLSLCHWYWVDGKFTGNKIVAKLYQATARLWGNRPAAAIIALAARTDEIGGNAWQVMERFLQDVAPLKNVLDRAVSN